MKYGTTTSGSWELDETGLPCFDLSCTRARPSPPVLRSIGSADMAVLADQSGRVHLYSIPNAAWLSPQPFADNGCGAFWVRLTAGDATRLLLPSQARDNEEAVMRCGPGYVEYRATVHIAPDTALAYSLLVSGIPGATTVAVQLRLELPPGSAPIDVVAEAIADFTPGNLSEDGPCAVFARGGMGMFSHHLPDVGDCFLAAPEPWTAHGAPHRIRARWTGQLEPESPLTAPFIVGHRCDCTLEWLGGTLAEAAPSEPAEAWRNRLEDTELRFPELWMQHEDTWDRYNAMALVESAIPELRADDQAATRSLPTRDALVLAVAFAAFAPPMALELLLDVATRQAANGRLPEQKGTSPAAQLDPFVDRSDLEILFLVACTEYLAAVDTHSCLDTKCGWCDGGGTRLWQHLVAACTFVRDELRTGPNGHVRILAGDWCGSLDSVGRHGRGESVLNSAMLCYALKPLHALARERGETRLADVFASWHRALRLAVGSAFDREWFVRGFTDEGSSFGSPQEGRCFLDVQAWAVLAKCGSAIHRDTALRQALEINRSPGGLCCLSAPYDTPPPDSISRSLTLPGENWNAGVRTPEAAWFIWALASERMTEDAMREWESLTIRARLADPASPGLAALHATQSLCSGHAGWRRGALPLAMQDRPLAPTPHACAWQPFAMRKILGRQPPAGTVNSDKATPVPQTSPPGDPDAPIPASTDEMSGVP